LPKLIDNAADKIKQLAELIAENEPQRLEDHITFWERWFNDEIKGSKATIINEIEGKIVGVVRLWNTPYLNKGYLIEGLYVSEKHRKKGIARDMLQEAINYLKDAKEHYLYSLINRKNISSIKTHLALGFELKERDTLNSFGDPRKELDAYIKKL
jgi:RimJ/RimL family protein N-acetyltransferase